MEASMRVTVGEQVILSAWLSNHPSRWNTCQQRSSRLRKLKEGNFIWWHSWWKPGWKFRNFDLLEAEHEQGETKWEGDGEGKERERMCGCVFGEESRTQSYRVNKKYGDFSWRSTGWDFAFQCGEWGWSVFGQLGSHMPQDQGMKP